ncbi:MAG: HAMP domain-containing histidine kinase [Burkholderiales bacterium]|nr:HAMP domain-containing histidine kinase [Burkholderiales bacterium]
MPPRLRLPRSLRLRVAFTFAWFGALVSLLLAAGLYVSARDLGTRLLDETLRAEMEDYLARRARNPHSLPPHTLMLRGYVLGPEASREIPEAVRTLPLGQYSIPLEGRPYRVIVAERAGVRHVMMFDETPHIQRERRFLYVLAAGVAIMTLLSAAGGYWLAGRVVAPVTRLAREISEADPDAQAPALASHFGDDEVGEMARAFDAYIERLRAFIARERAFTADVSHELRTPLAVIQGATEVLQEDPSLNGRQQQRIARIARASRDMVELITALLLLAREETARANPDERCSVREVLTECIEHHRPLIADRAIRLELALDADLWLPVERTLLAVVIGNLIRNAFTYTQGGTVRIRLSGDRLVVEDTGIGIRADELARVFERYYRGAASKGAGIGLSLVKRICDRQGWSITLDSEEGRGTTAQLVFRSSIGPTIG